jgi:hypothetical protein
VQFPPSRLRLSRHLDLGGSFPTSDVEGTYHVPHRTPTYNTVPTSFSQVQDSAPFMAKQIQADALVIGLTCC